MAESNNTDKSKDEIRDLALKIAREHTTAENAGAVIEGLARFYTALSPSRVVDTRSPESPAGQTPTVARAPAPQDPAKPEPKPRQAAKPEPEPEQSAKGITPEEFNRRIAKVLNALDSASRAAARDAMKKKIQEAAGSPTGTSADLTPEAREALACSFESQAPGV